VIHFEPVVIPNELVQAARLGSEAATSQIWDLCGPIVHGSVVRVAGWNRAEAAEVVQEAALVLLSILQEPEQQPSLDFDALVPSFAQRFYRKLQFRIRTYLRAERRRAARTVSTSTPGLETALARRGVSLAPTTTGRSIERALERLSPRQRAVVAGLYFKDENVGSIASELRISHQAVTALHRRALAVLRVALEE
jgi:RNA polymerase sigma factor (sigma-70 family)